MDPEEGPVKKRKLSNSAVDHPKETSPENISQNESTIHQTQSSEIDVGIKEYVSKHDGFHGIIKQRQYLAISKFN